MVFLFLALLISIGAGLTAASSLEFIDLPRRYFNEGGKNELVIPVTFSGDRKAITYWREGVDEADLFAKIREDAEQHYCPLLVQESIMRATMLQADCNNLISYVEQATKSLNESWIGSTGVDYLTVVRSAVTSDNAFSTFKSHPAYQFVVETDTKEVGYANLNHLAKWTDYLDSKNRWLLPLLHLLTENDRFGTPAETIKMTLQVDMTQALGGTDGVTSASSSSSSSASVSSAGAAGTATTEADVEMSPSTMRFLKVAHDLDLLFDLFHRQGDSIRGKVAPEGETSLGLSASGASEPKRVVEIGVGYGGQAQALFAVQAAFNTALGYPHSPRQRGQLSYYLYDLPDVLHLAEKYTSKFPWMTQQEAVDGSEGAVGGGAGVLHFMHDAQQPRLQHQLQQERSLRFDVCISSCAVSELSKELQQHYIDSVLRYCDAGYIVYNKLTYIDRMSGYSAQEFGTRLRHAWGEENGRRRGAAVASDLPLFYFEHDESPHNTLIVWNNRTAVPQPLLH